MPFIDFNTKKKVKLFDGISSAIAHSDQISFCQVTLEKGAAVPEHQHVHEQWSYVIEGQLELTMEGETKILQPGMGAYIPSNTPHSARSVATCKVIDCFLPVREDFKDL